MISKSRGTDRRAFLTTAFAGVAGVGRLAAQAPPQISSVPSSRDFNRQDPIQYPDPDIVALDPRFRRYIVGNTTIKRLHIGTLWAEGPAWSGVGRGTGLVRQNAGALSGCRHSFPRPTF